MKYFFTTTLFCLSIAFFSCSKSGTGTAPVPTVTFTAGAAAVAYSGSFDSSAFKGAGLTNYLLTTGVGGYIITAGNTSKDIIRLSFNSSYPLVSGTSIANGYATAVYTIGDSTYGTSSHCTIQINSVTNNLLSGTFSADLQSGKGTPVSITNGTFNNLSINY